MKRTIILRDPEPAAGTSGRGRSVRAVLTLLCALIADGLQWWLPPLWPVCDGAMVLAVLLIWGWRWEIAVAVIPELIPGLALVPTWTLFAGYLVLSRGSETTRGAAPKKTIESKR